MLRLWLRFAVLLLAIVAIGFTPGLYILPNGLGWFVGALILAAVEHKDVYVSIHKSAQQASLQWQPFASPRTSTAP